MIIIERGVILKWLVTGRGFMQVGNLYSVCPEPLPIENILLKLCTKADSYSSSPN